VPVTPSGRKISIEARRHCRKCGTSTEQIAHGIRYTKPESSEMYTKTIFWVCTVCGDHTEEVKQIPPETERLMLTKRLLKASEDYDLVDATIESRGHELIFRARFPPYDVERLRQVLNRYHEDGFITAKELMELEEAGMRPGTPEGVRMKAFPRRMLDKEYLGKRFWAETA